MRPLFGESIYLRISHAATSFLCWFFNVRVERAAEERHYVASQQFGHNSIVTGHRSKEHYVPLDSVRGIAALCVVVHHFVISQPLAAVLPNRAWIDFAFFHNAWLFVDLFFVLSGIVISMSYVQGGFGTFEFREYIVRRLARIYPLHIVTLLAFLSFRMMKLGLVGAGLIHFAPPEMAVNNGYSFFLNVLLLHALGFVDHLSWNGPSWSISAEFYTYLVFGGVVILAQRFRDVRIIYVMSLVLSLAGCAFILLVLHHYTLDFQSYGIARCILSFFLGVLALRAGVGFSCRAPVSTVALADRGRDGGHCHCLRGRDAADAELSRSGRIRCLAWVADGVPRTWAAQAAVGQAAGVAR